VSQPYTRREAATLFAAAGASAMLSSPAAARAQKPAFLFSYFEHSTKTEPGLRLALSEDGLTYRALRGGARFLIPEVGESKLMRDPFLFKGAGRNAPWHLVWTTAWEGATIGHATSHDLINWSAQQAIPVMANTPGTRNCWAPEAMWDPVTRQYVIFWASTVKGRFPETAGTSESAYNHRMYCTTTRDFQSFTPSRLFYDPGFSVIDATFFRDARNRLHMIVKDETLKPERKHLRVARTRTALGPFGPLSAPLPGNWVEGPTAITIGCDTIVFFDRYREGKYGAVRSRDLLSWEDISSQIHMPPGASHGTIVPLSDTALLKRLRNLT
jgi:hypothetical protein